MARGRGTVDLGTPKRPWQGQIRDLSGTHVPNTVRSASAALPQVTGQLGHRPGRQDDLRRVLRVVGHQDGRTSVESGHLRRAVSSHRTSVHVAACNRPAGDPR